MGKRLVAIVVLLVAMVSVPLGTPVRGATTTPAVGDWPFCVTTEDVGCVDYLGFEDSEGAMREYTSFAEARNAGIILEVRCMKTLMTNGDLCAPRSAIGCGSAGPQFQIGISPNPMDRNFQPRDTSELVGRRFDVRVRTGDFDPAFSLGGQIEWTRRTKLPSGLFTFEVNGLIQKSYSVNYQSVEMQPYETFRSRLSKFLSTSKATTVGYGGGVSVYHSEFLKSTSLELGGYCAKMPFTGGFADANGMGFTTSWVPAKPTDPVVSTIKLEVSGPHYLPESNGNDGKVVPARIRFFLPDEFFAEAGYDDPSAFDASRLLITTLDGEKTVPTLTRKAGGVLVDFGISHYSAPDPVVTLYRYGMTAAVTTTVPATTTSVAPVVTTSPAAPSTSVLWVIKGKSLSAAQLVSSAGLSRPSGSKVSVKVSAAGARYCRVVGASVKGLKTGMCRVTITVKPAKGAAKSKTVTVTVG